MKSIRRSLILGVLVVTVVIFAIAAVALDVGIRYVLVREFDTTLKARALAMAALTTWEGGQLEMKLPRDISDEYRPRRHAGYFELWRADESAFARSASLGSSGHLTPPADPTMTPTYWPLTLPNGEGGRAVVFQFVPASDESNKVQAVDGSRLPLTLMIARDLDPVDDTLEALRIVLLVVLVGILTALIVTIRQAVRHGLAPLAVVAAQAGNINASSLCQRFPVDNLPAELEPICLRLNDLLARLEQSFERERQFTADAAHELRTPIAELRSLAEVSLKWPDDTAATRNSFADALEIAGNMENIVCGLLELARCESDTQSGVTRTSVRVNELIEENWQMFKEGAHARHLDFACEVPANISIETDRAFYGVILKNLLSNAVEYTPVSGRVRISAEQNSSGISLTIANTVNDLTQADLPHLFERFWRKDPARTTSGHAGLGLSLAKGFADLLGLTLTARLTGDLLIMTLAGPADKASLQREGASGK